VAGEMIGNAVSRAMSLTKGSSMRPMAMVGTLPKILHPRTTIPIPGTIGMTKARRTSLRNRTRAVTHGPAGMTGRMTVLVLAITAPPTRVATRMGPPAARIGRRAASAEVSLFPHRAILSGLLLYARKLERPVVGIIGDTETVG